MIKFSQTSIDSKIQNLRREAEERDAKRRAEEEGYPYLDLRKQAIDRAALEIVPENLAREAEAIPFQKEKNQIGVAARTSKGDGLGKLQLYLEENKLKMGIFISSMSGIEEALGAYASVRVEDRGEIVSEIKITDQDFESKAGVTSVATASKDAESINSDASTTSVLVTLLADAIVLQASDIHIEAERDNAIVRFRIDGILYEVTKIPKDVHRRTIGRIKLLSNLKLNIQDQAQDGRFTIKRTKGDIEMRVSIIPAEYGESAVMRILDPTTINIGLTELGLRKDDEETIRRIIRLPNGMVLNTGPTGSGKTTTLYAFLKENSSPETKTVTIEDPIEYHLEGIEQTQVSPKDGYTFALGLRSILRQDPDILLVGEIRDTETARTAIDAALTGHLVFSTLHTNDTAGAIPRLTDLGVRPDSITAAVNLVIAQRLVRKLCDVCKKKAEIDESMTENIKKLFGALPDDALTETKRPVLYTRGNCDECEDGYKGRIGIFELLILDESYEEFLSQKAGEAKVRSHARGRGMVYMQEDGILKALRGITDLEEVERVTGPIEWPEAYDRRRGFQGAVPTWRS